MRLSYTAEALLEMSEAASYYRICRKELARAFKQRIEVAEEEVMLHPNAWRSLGAALARLTGASC